MPQSAYKPSEPVEDELDELARAIREELRAVGFSPAFDDTPQEKARARQVAADRSKARLAAGGRLVFAYLAPMLAITAFAAALHFLMPGI